MTALAEAPATPAPAPGRPAVRGAHPVLRFLVRRVAAAVLTLAVLSVLVFLATSVLPGDTASAILGRQATAADLAELRARLGLDRPLVVQYADWAGGLLRGDLGLSAAGTAAGGQVSVWSQVSGPLANSAVLAAVAFVPIVLLSLVLGVVSALRVGRWQDTLVSSLTLVPAALPEFVLGALLIVVFFTWLRLYPPVSLIAPDVSPLATPELLVLPVLTLVGVTVGPAVRMIRAGMLTALAADTVAVARLNGISESRVVRRYALRNALAPSIQVFAFIGQYLVGGLLIVEYLFGYPGIGKQLVDSITVHDNTAVQSITMLLAVVYVTITIVADLVVMLVVPRLRTGGGTS